MNAPRLRSPGTRSGLLVAAYLAVGVLRSALATAAPAETTDVLRNLGYGKAFWTHGLRVYDLTAMDLGSVAGWHQLWPEHTFDYPIVALLFFAALAAVSTSLVVARIVLSALELANALLVSRLTGSRLLGLAYFASPASLWWVSHEGQFEPVAVLFMLLGLAALRTGRGPVAYVCLAAAVQTKLVPLLLLPAFLARSRERRSLAAFAIAFLPSLVALTASRYIGRMLEDGYWATGYNPFAWKSWTTEPFAWMPRPLVTAEAILSDFLVVWSIVVLARALVRRDLPRAVSALPVLTFLVVLKSASWAQFWYLLLVPGFALALERREDHVPFLLAAFLEPRAASALFVGPVGNPQWFRIDRFLHGGV